jgi:hypothetical protein
MRWPSTEKDAEIWLSGASWALLVFWLTVFAVTYLTRGG